MLILFVGYVVVGLMYAGMLGAEDPTGHWLKHLIMILLWPVIALAIVIFLVVLLLFASSL